MNWKATCLFYFLISVVCTLQAQEVLYELSCNPKLFHQNKWEQNVNRQIVSLPFNEDFSYDSIYPRNDLWMDNDVFVNFTYPLDPVTIGVATFDGLNANGIPYDTFDLEHIGGADTLTSVPILLGALVPADGVFLSFFYQPQGLGDKPNDYLFNQTNFGEDFGDSLILEFKDVNQTWLHIWSMDGLPLQPFDQVMIEISNPDFLHDDFQFRFRNIATLGGNNDHWHIDYIELDEGRFSGDTILTDVAIVYYPTSILGTYEEMPWNQFFNYQGTELGATHRLTLRNNFNVVKNTVFEFDATETYSATPVFSSLQTAINFPALTTDTFELSTFPIASDFTSDTVNIQTIYTASASGDNNLQNDLVARNQIFGNWLSYDDGSAEKAYGLLGVGAKMAVEFHLNEPDSLQAVLIHFAHINADVENLLFNIVVWSELFPDETEIYRQNLLHPEYVDSINGFAFFRIDTPQLLPAGVFYLGIQQTFNDLLNVGFDRNDTLVNKLFYYTNGVWDTSQFAGALMIRPVIGDFIPFGVGMESVQANETIIVFPNPAGKQINVRASDEVYLQVLDIAGRVMLNAGNCKSIDISSLPDGFYLLDVKFLEDRITEIIKFVKED